MFRYLFSASILFAAGPALSQGGPGMPWGPQGQFGPGRAPVTNAPYSATYTSTSTEKLQDGTVLNESRTRTVARDSLGRTREETSLPVHGTSSGTGATHTMVVILDPVAHTVTQLRPEDKVAVVHPLPQANEGAEHLYPHGGEAGVRPASPTSAAPGSEAGPRGLRHDKNVVKTDLGSQTISGVVATGTRITRTVPAGEVGNAAPIVSTHEDWFSPDLKIEVKRTDVDPFHGTRTTIATALSKDEPAPALFQVPVGYTVQQAKSRGFGHSGGPARSHQPGDMPPPHGDAVPPPAGL